MRVSLPDTGWLLLLVNMNGREEYSVSPRRDTLLIRFALGERFEI